MAPVMLPPPTRETQIEMRELSWSRDMEPTTGGKAQRQDRLGTRHAITFDIPTLRYAWCGAGMAADLALGRTGDGAAVEIPEPFIPDVEYGAAPKIDGAPQVGRNIAVKDLTPGVVIKKGKWLNFVINGRYYAYFTTAEVTVGVNGKAVLPIYPMIRRSPADGSQLRLKKPLIQGLITDPQKRKLSRRTVALSFDIKEQE